MRRGFTLLEVVVVAMVIGVVAAVSISAFRSAVARNEARKAVAAHIALVSRIRDQARGSGVCLDYVLNPPPPLPGPYKVDVFRVPCPTDRMAPAVPVESHAVSPRVTAITAHPVVDGIQLPVFTGVVRFDRDGAVYEPPTTVQFNLLVDDTVSAFRLYPAAGTIEEVETP